MERPLRVEITDDEVDLRNNLTVINGKVKQIELELLNGNTLVIRAEANYSMFGSGTVYLIIEVEKPEVEKEK